MIILLLHFPGPPIYAADSVHFYHYCHHPYHHHLRCVQGPIWPILLSQASELIQHPMRNLAVYYTMDPS